MEVLSLRKNTKKKSYIQKIIFGSPGTGKSHLIKSVFHPEYTYGDFMEKLLPLPR